jgi:signal recognition particle receptor subunit beta
VVFINHTTMQMTAKIVYYGPGLCGKTTNLQYIHQKTAPKSRGEMISLETETDRTLFFDLLPLDVGVIGGMKVRLQLYTVPGQVFYNATRKLVLKGVDGVVFVADSQQAAYDANVEAFNNLQENLKEMGQAVGEVPVVLQYNKRDIRNIVPVEKLNEGLNTFGLPYFEAAALHGIGVFETLKAASRLVLSSVRNRVATGGDPAPRRIAMPQAPSSAPAPAAPAPPPAPAPAPAAAPVAAPKPAPVAAPAPAAPKRPVPAPAPAPVTPSRPVRAAAPMPAPAPAHTPDDLRVEFAEEDPEKHVVRAVSTKGSLDIQDALAKLRTSVASTPARTAGAGRTPVPGPPSDLDRRLKDVMGSVADNNEARQELRKRVTIEVPPEMLRLASNIVVHIGFEKDGREVTIPERLILKLTNNRKLALAALHLDVDLKAKG